MTGLLALGVALASPGSAAEGPARLLKDINQVPSEDRGSYPHAFTRLGDLMLFRAQTHATGFELWRTDGTAAGTSLVKDVRPGPYSGLDWPSSVGAPAGFVEANGVLLFPADDGVHGLELWRTDGTADGTFMLKDVLPGTYGGLFTFEGSDPRNLVWVHAVSGGALYFLADDGVHGFELWRTDGTQVGTSLLQDIQPGTRSAFGSYGSYSLEGVTFGASFYFRAANDASGSELWRTDGTTTGTEMVADIQPGPGGSFPGGLTVFAEGLLFSAAGSEYDAELWRSDGTAFGTALVRDIFPGLFGSAPRQLTRVGDFVYFQVYQYLYRTNGTPGGDHPPPHLPWRLHAAPRGAARPAPPPSGRRRPRLGALDFRRDPGGDGPPAGHPSREQPAGEARLRGVGPRFRAHRPGRLCRRELRAASRSARTDAPRPRRGRGSRRVRARPRALPGRRVALRTQVCLVRRRRPLTPCHQVGPARSSDAHDATIRL